MKLRKLLSTIFVLTLLLVGTFIPNPINKLVHADELAEWKKRREELEEELPQIKNQLEEVQGLMAQEEATQGNLSQSISYISYQISNTELTIQEKEGDIEKKGIEVKILGVEIKDTKKQISELTDTIDRLETVIGERTKANYMNSKISPVEHIVASDSISALVRRLKYFAAIRQHDATLIKDFSRNKAELEFQKDALSDKKSEVETLKAQIEEEKVNLEKAREELTWQKEQKNQLLIESHNRENQYYSQKVSLSEEQAAKEAELAEIQTNIALATLGISGEEIKQGDVIGRQGNTGYSSGSHLHFMVKENGALQNPLTYLNNGIFQWPISGAGITQLFGMTDYATQCEPSQSEPNYDSISCFYADPLVRANSSPYAYPQKYSGYNVLGYYRSPFYPYDWDYDGYPNIHNGLDMAAADGSNVYAVKDGTVCHGHDSAGAQYAIVDHGNGLFTYYWHLQEIDLNTCN